MRDSVGMAIASKTGVNGSTSLEKKTDSSMTAVKRLLLKENPRNFFSLLPPVSEFAVKPAVILTYN